METNTPPKTKPVKQDSVALAVQKAKLATEKKFAANKKFNAANALQGSTASVKQLNVDRYITYGSETFGKLGFDPYRDNEEFYNENTSDSQEYHRALKGAIKLAGVGFQDTIGLGAFAKEDSYKDFADINSDYQVSWKRGGNTAFWANTILSSGYTAGIIGAIAAEEIAIGLTTGGLGLVGSGGMVGRGLNKALTGLGRGSAARLAGSNAGRTTLEAMRELHEAENAAAAYQRYSKFEKLGANFVKGAKDVAKNSLNQLNPIGNLATFLKDLDNMHNVNGFVKAANGVGAVVRDARKFTMTHGESKMEAEMNRDETITQAKEDWRKLHPNEELTDDVLADIFARGDEAYKKTYEANFGLIYATNALAFDNMFRNMKFNNKWFKTTEAGRITLNNSGRVGANFGVGKQGLIAGTKRKFSKWAAEHITVGGLMRNTLSMGSEGFQEYAQDAISQGAKSFALQTDPAKQAQGGYYSSIFDEYSDFLYNHVGQGMRDAYSDKGLGTFLSGALMGLVSSPVGMATGAIQKAVIGGGPKAITGDEYKKNEAKAELLNEMLKNNPEKFYQFVDKPLFRQTDIQEKILEAIEKGDKKTLEDLKQETFGLQVNTLLEQGAAVEFADHLKSMADKFTPQQLNEALGRDNITEDNVQSVRDNLRQKSEDIHKLKAVHEAIQENFVNPINVNLLDKKDPEYLEKLDQFQAHEDFKRELLFSHARMATLARRLTSLDKKIGDSANGIKLSSLDVNALLSPTDLNKSIELLNTEIKSLKDLNSSNLGSKKQLQVAEEKLEALTQYKEAYSKLKNVKSNLSVSDTELEDVHDELFDAFNKFVGVNQSAANTGLERMVNPQSVLNREVFADVFDYLTLSDDHEAYQDHINYIRDPKNASAFISATKEVNRRKRENVKGHIQDSMNAFSARTNTSKMLSILLDSGIFFDMNEIDDLVKKGIMPSKIYDADTHEPASKEQVAKAQEIINAFYKNLTGKSISNDKSTTSVVRNKSEKDKRTVAQILKQYGITLNTPVELSSKQGQRLLDKILNSPELTVAEKEMLSALLDKGGSIQFTNTAELPITLEDGIVTIDVRYAGADYKNTRVSFESLVLTSLLQKVVVDKVQSDENFKGEVEDLMEQAKAAIIEDFKQRGQAVPSIALFENAAAFLVEGLNNPYLQRVLQKTKNTTDVKNNTLWSKLKLLLKVAMRSSGENTLLDKAVNLTHAAIFNTELEKAEAPTQTPEPTPTVETTIENESVVDRVSELQDEIRTKEAQLAAYRNEVKNASKLSFRKVNRLNNLISKLSVEINELTMELNDITGSGNQPSQPANRPSTPRNYVADKDEFGNTILNKNTPIGLFPSDVIQDLTVYFGKDVTNLDDQDEVKFRKMLEENPLVISILHKHNTHNFSASADEQEIRQRNEYAIEEGRELAERRKEEWDALTAERKRNKKDKTPKTSREIVTAILDKISTSEDIDVLTDSELSDLISAYRKREISAQDIVSFIGQRKKSLAEQAQDEYEREMRFLIEMEQEMRDEEIDAQNKKAIDEHSRLSKARKAIAANLELLSQKNLKAWMDKPSKRNPERQVPIRVSISKSMIRFYETYHADLLMLEDKVEFIKQLKVLKKSISVQKQNLAKTLTFSSDVTESKKQLIDLFTSLESTGVLVPSIATTINKKLKEANLPFRLTMSENAKQYETIGSIYHIKTLNTISKYKPTTEKKFREGSYAYKKNAVSTFEIVGTTKADAELAVIQWFLGGGKVSKPALESLFRSKLGINETDSREITSRKSLMGEGGLKSTDSLNLAELTPAFENFDFEATDSNLSMDAVESVLTNCTNLKEMVEYGWSIISEQEFTDSEYEKMDKAQKEKEEYDRTAETLYYSTEAGKKEIQDSLAAQKAYYESSLFEIENGIFKGSVEALSEVEREAYDLAVERGLYPEVAKELEAQKMREAEEQEIADKLKRVQEQEAQQASKDYNDFLNSYIDKVEVFNVTEFDIIGQMFKALNTNSVTTKDLLFMFQYAGDGVRTLSEPQRKALIGRVSDYFRTGNANTSKTGEVVISNTDTSYEIVDYSTTDDKLILKNVKTGTTRMISLTEFFKNIKTTATSGETVVKQKVDISVKKEDAASLVDSITNIFTNFGKVLSENEGKSQEEIESSIIENLNNCI